MCSSCGGHKGGRGGQSEVGEFGSCCRFMCIKVEHNSPPPKDIESIVRHRSRHGLSTLALIYCASRAIPNATYSDRKHDWIQARNALGDEFLLRVKFNGTFACERKARHSKREILDERVYVNVR